jgi:hypothetical protein
MKADDKKMPDVGAARRSPAASVSISITLPIGKVSQLAAPKTQDALNVLLAQLSEGDRDPPVRRSDHSHQMNALREDFELSGDIISVRNFISARCECDRSYRERASTLLTEYEKWAAPQCASTLTPKAFGDALAALGFLSRKSNFAFWCGLRVKASPSSEPSHGVTDVA